ncbi:hypothetical protein PN36_33125 [Candidatus Thiomargarita nelsonii]|uniref:Uncharacterized protein n=1 Tax=Candidatus Thiomargarita nelsonii TaxID=1003181 RepID=A0A4E0RBC2_9GAMM|nr:hypothetical protein PN36_33125 [Candidatus Thiomargarita nelsonii]
MNCFNQGNPCWWGGDQHSLYCYLLALEEHRDAETWAIHLWDLEQQGLHPERIIADGGKGLRAGQAFLVKPISFMVCAILHD